jgi:hypothetical protein
MHPKVYRRNSRFNSPISTRYYTRGPLIARFWSTVFPAGNTTLPQVSSATGYGPPGTIQLTALMDRISGRAEISIGRIDGPMLLSHPELTSEHIREVPGKLRGTCARSDSIACMHGTFVAGILSARRGSASPAICPVCSLLLRPIFYEVPGLDNVVPSASAQELAEAIIDTIDAGAWIINLSSALAQASPKGENKLEEALNYAAHHGAIIVAAAGNQGTVGSSAITRHPWVIPVKKPLHFTFDKHRRFAFGARKSLGLDFPGRIHRQHSFFGQPGKQHPNVRGLTLFAPPVFPALRPDFLLLRV